VTGKWARRSGRKKHYAHCAKEYPAAGEALLRGVFLETDEPAAHVPYRQLVLSDSCLIVAHENITDELATADLHVVIQGGATLASLLYNLKKLNLSDNALEALVVIAMGNDLVEGGDFRVISPATWTRVTRPRLDTVVIPGLVTEMLRVLRTCLVVACGESGVCSPESWNNEA